ncbi:GNAT family N-acetyltransferase [Clostridium sp. P21]|uniref:GNAT family N-acetyltransferase n=1 Tax=Clostridium muellerianum TaxID=2716538 RepID=A0A7Y0EFQ7_9CLOT|nr:GNAT family N-acetyltransferase [Clostridium muellerianum]NMM62292.1 GNAT family N-acetyltransferase [Clostridium muellerianum]
MDYRLNEKIPILTLADLRQSVGWNRMERELGNPKLQDFLTIACYDNSKLIGYVSVVSNGVLDAYIQDLMVRPDHQNKGIGTELMNKAISYIKEKGIYMISVIYGEEELRSFYERFGFYTMLCGQIETYKSK